MLSELLEVFMVRESAVAGEMPGVSDGDRLVMGGMDMQCCSCLRDESRDAGMFLVVSQSDDPVCYRAL